MNQGTPFLKFLRILPLLLIAGLSIAGYVACGDDDDSTETPTATESSLASETPPGETGTPIVGTPLEVYFAQVEEIAVRADREQERIIEEYNATDAPEDERNDKLREVIRQSGRVTETAANQLSQVLPPPEIVAEHNTYLEKMRNVQQVFDQMADNMEKATTEEEFDALFEQYSIDFARVDKEFDDACEAMFKIADAMDLEPRLCGN